MFGKQKNRQPIVEQPSPETLLHQAMVKQSIVLLAEKRDLLKRYHQELLDRLTHHVVSIAGIGRLTLHQSGGVINIDPDTILEGLAVDRLNFGVNVAGNPLSMEIDLHMRDEPRSNVHKYLFTGQQFEKDGVVHRMFDPEVMNDINPFDIVGKCLSDAALSQCIELTPITHESVFVTA